MSTVEFHPWSSRRSDTERPDEWRIDLDPMPKCEFDTVRRVAHVAHEVLDELGAVGWPKTSGGSGSAHLRAHRAGRGFGDVRRAALAFARGWSGGPLTGDHHVVAQGPRPRAVFVDYNQNARDHTMAAAYSVRGVPQATCRPRSRWEEIMRSGPGTSPWRPCPLGSPPWATCTRASMPPCSGRQLLEWAARDEQAGGGGRRRRARRRDAALSARAAPTPRRGNSGTAVGPEAIAVRALDWRQ